MKKRFICAAFVLFVCLMFAGSSFAAQKAGESTSQKEVSQKVKDALEAIKNYSAQQRDEALKKVKVAVDAMDARLQNLEDRIQTKWDQMDQATRDKARSAQQSLRKQRLELAEWYGEMRQSSSKAWDHVKKGLLDSYDSLSKAFDKAVKEY
jgi:DNA anti-recombination protein RmuC